jgi:prophage antirepressor-like protein
MKELNVVKETEILGKKIVMYGTIENPLFKADDVAIWIEHSNTSKMVSKIDNDEKLKAQISTLTNSYTAIFLTEDGLYEVCMQSRKPIAK